MATKQTWSIEASVLFIPIHNGMVVAVQDTSADKTTAGLARRLKKAVSGLSFEQIKSDFSRMQHADKISVQKVVKA